MLEVVIGVIIKGPSCHYAMQIMFIYSIKCCLFLFVCQFEWLKFDKIVLDGRKSFMLLFFFSSIKDFGARLDHHEPIILTLLCGLVENYTFFQCDENWIESVGSID